MKLYATITTERMSRPAKKGADKQFIIDITNGNKRMVSILALADSNSLTVLKEKGVEVNILDYDQA